MVSLSLCMIAKDEEASLKDCLNSARPFVDEIIFVDTGSKDSTKEIAKQFDAKVFDFEWVDDFSKARNFSLSKAKSDWILVLDADEIILPEDFKSIKRLISEGEADAYSLRQLNYTNNSSEFGFIKLKERKPEYKDFQGLVSCNVLRLFRNTKKIYFANPVHESVYSSIKSNKMKVAITDMNIHHYQELKGNVYEKQLRYLNIYEANIETAPNKAKAHRDLGILYSNFKNEPEKAIFHFKESLKHNPKNMKTYAGLGFVLLNSGKIPEAKEVFMKALEINKLIPEIYVGLATANIRENDFVSAISNFKKALKLGYAKKAEVDGIIKGLEEEMSRTSFKSKISFGQSE